MATIFWMNKEIARGMVCFFHQKKHSYLILFKKLGKNRFFLSRYATFLPIPFALCGAELIEF
jgi:hypothetical protein